MLILLVLSNHNFNETSVVLENTVYFAIICLVPALFPASLTILCVTTSTYAAFILSAIYAIENRCSFTI